ncbi:MAG: DNA-formamidopyrimidine glycosylase [Omnitrophica WOR_2 bacterium GWA2_47_8]|nr:MAG: DNA-formamidopyrimidine glycosylase [Omnitrophica WOR_2 bacterium GWA2_47_8]
MPELPEVETIRRDLSKFILNQTIEDIAVHDKRVIRRSSVPLFIKRSKGQKIIDVQRRGKAIVMVLDRQGFLVVQPMMTGQLIYQKNGTLEAPKAAKVIFTLSNGGRLIYNDQRLFGRVYFTADLREIDYFRTIGPEPLEKGFNVPWLQKAIIKKRGPIKPLLMDQHFVAGIGNIYASEILFRSRIHPQRSAYTLRKEELQALHKATRMILKEAISSRGTSMRNYLDGQGEKGQFKNRILVYARENEICVDCKGVIKRFVQAGRSTFYCEGCQK